MDWYNAHAYGPPMSTIQGGGAPYAAALMLPSLSSTTKAQLSRISSGVGPSLADPSGYTSPDTRPSRGLMCHLNVSTLDLFRSGKEGLTVRPLSHVGSPHL